MKHLSPPDSCRAGGSQSYSSEVRPACSRGRRKVPGDQVPRLGLRAGCGEAGSTAASAQFCLPSAREGGSKTSGSSGGRDVTCPPTELNPRYPLWLLISAVATWRGEETGLPDIRTGSKYRISLESAGKAPKQAITGCWQSGCVVSVLQVWAWLMRKL